MTEVIMEYYPLIKSLHIIFVVTWFAGLFYMPRILIHQTEAAEKPEPDRSILIDHTKRTSRLLWKGITWPSAIMTLFLGGSLFYLWLDNLDTWLWVKLGFVAVLYMYQFATGSIFKKLQNDEYSMSSSALRMWNEIPTVILFAVVFLVIYKTTISMVYGLGGLFILIAAIMLGVKFYKRLRASKER